MAPGGEADRRPRRGRRAAGTPAGTPRCRRRRWPVSGSSPRPGPEIPGGRGRRAWIIRRPEPRQVARPRKYHGRLRFSSSARGRTTWLPGALALCPGVTLSDAGGHRERAHSRRYLKPHFGCPCCNRGKALSLGEDTYLQWCLGCSRCNSRRCFLACRAPWLARRVPFRRPRLADQLPGGAWCRRAANGPALELGVPGDGRGLDLSGAATGTGLCGRRRGVVASSRRLPCPPRRTYSSTWPAARYRPALGSSPAAGNGFIGSQVTRRCSSQRTHRVGAVPPDRDDAGHASFLQLRR
jgi:hypothetical protein